MKIAKLFLKYTATVLLFMLIGRSYASAQVTYNSKNTATVTAVAPGNVQVTDISNAGTTINRLDGDETPVIFPMIGLAKTAGNPVIQNDGTYNITYTLMVRNYSGIPLNNIQITDDLTTAFPLPATFTMVGVVTKLTSNSTNGAGAIAVNTAFNGTTDKNLLLPATSSLGGMPNPASGTAYYASIRFTINVNVNGNYTTYNNTATTTATTDTPDPVTVTDISNNNTSPHNGDNTKTPLFYNVPTPVALQTSDIRVLKTVDNLTPKEGDNVVFEIKVRNLGAGDAAPVVVSDLLPAGFQLISATPSVGTYNAGTGTWSIGVLAVGAANEKTLSITAKVVANRPAGDYVNTASSNHPQDPVTPNNTSTVTLTPVPSADLKITNTDGKTLYVPGTSNTYTMVVTNDGPSNVTSATVTNTLPAGVTGTWTAVYTGGATGTANGTNSISELVNMPSGSTITYTYVVNVPSGTTGNFVNTATVAVPAGVTDPTPANNTATDTDTQNSTADLQLTNTDGKTAYIPGTTNTYTMVVTNAGPSNVTGATIANTLPVGVTGTWTAVYAGGATGTANGTNSISELVNMPSGSTITYTYVVNVPSGTTGSFVNTGTVTAPAGVTDPTPANNTATDTDTQNSVVDLKITNTDGKTQYIPGTTNTYTMVVINDGPSDVTAATVANTLPAGVTGTWTVVYTGGATGNANGTGSISELVNMPSGATATYTYIVSVPSNYTGNFVNTGTVTAPVGVTDPTPANNTATDTDTQNSTADLQITNTDGKTQYVPGTTNTYTMVVTNAGPSDVTGATVANTLPAGVTGTWTVVYTGGATGNANGTGSISELVNMPSGATATYTFIVDVPSSYTGNFVNTGTVTTPVGVTDPTPANNTATDTDTQNSIADLQITNTDGKTDYTPGTSNTYTMVVTNTGPSNVVGATVANTLPAGVTGTWTAVYAGGATGAANGTNSISEAVNMPSGSTITYTYVVNVPSSTTGNFVNTATVTAPVGVTDPTPANNTATDTDTQNSIADLRITNTDGKTQYIPGTTNSYTMVVTNDGPSNVIGATIANTLPMGVTGTWTAVYAGGATGAANGTNSISEAVNMPSGSTITYTYVVNVPSSYTGNFVNTGTVTAPVGVTDPTPANNTATDTDTQNSVADLQITNTDGKLQYIPGTTNTYTIVASNVGPSDVTGATITNSLPAGVTGTWTAVYSGAASGTASGTGSISELVNLPSGTNVTYTYIVSVPSSYTGNFVNTATVATPVGVTDPTPANNTATDTDTQNSTADLKITNTDNKIPYVPGTSNTYTMVVTNDGPSDVIGATVANTLPAGVTGTWTVVYTGGATGNASGTGSISELVNMPSGATATYTFVVNVPSSYTGNFVNTGTVTAPAYVTDPTPANNTATDTDTQNSIADLRITNTDGKLQYVPGTTNTYTIVVDNDGPSDAVGATVANALPSGISTSSWTAVYTGGATGNANGTGGINETVNIPIGGKITYTVVMTIPSGRTGDMISIATVATPAGITDPTPANNSATDLDTQNSISDLRVTKIIDNMTPDAGSTVNFKITVVNGGPSDATGVKVTDLLKPGYTFISATPSVGTYNNVTGLWTIGNLIYNQSVELAIQAKVVPDALAADYVNTATVTGDQPDPTPANNTSTITPVPRQVVDLAIAKIVDNDTPDVGSEVTFSLSVKNNGPSKATNVIVDDLLKAGYTFVSAVPSMGSYDETSGKWYIGLLNANNTVTIAIKAKVNPDLGAGAYINTAVVSGDQFEHIKTNNIATVVPVPVPVADLQITKTASNNSPSINTNVVFTLTATNNGPSNATGVSVKDLLKAGYTFISATASTGAYTNATGIWTIGNLASGTSATLKVTALVKATGPYDNTATVTGTEKDPIPGNNTVTITPVPQATPVAVNDEVKLCGGGGATVIDVLANDLKSIADLDPSSVVITKEPLNGKITVDPVTGKVTYTPNAGYIGNDDFSYTVKDKNGGTSNVANVKITINQPIIAVNDNATTNPNTAVVIDILNNDIKGSADIVPNTVSITQQPSNGTLTIDPVTGKVTYTPNAGFFGTDSFKYTVKDANGCTSNVATVEIKLNDLPKIGLAKSVMAVQKQQNGSFNITYHFVVGNYGTAVLNNVSIKDDLRQTFKGDVFSVKSITSLGTLKVNPQYNGSTTTEMLLTGNTLAVGEVQHLEMVVNITLSNSKGTYYNSATAEGTSPSGLKSTDISTDGLKPDPTKPGDVTPSIPTPVDLTKPGEFIPEGFSPNQDGTNDTFVIRNTGNKHISIEIYNRWANRVYRSADYKNDWAGQSNEGVRVGSDLPEGTYFYIIIIDGKDKYVGSLTLKR